MSADCLFIYVNCFVRGRCPLSAGQDGKQQTTSVRQDVSACIRTSFSVSLVYLQKLRCVRTKSFLLLLRICSAMHVDGGVHLQITKTLLQKGVATDVLAKKKKKSMLLNLKNKIATD